MARQVNRAVPIKVVASAAVTTSSNSGNLAGSVNAILPSDAVSIFLDVTAHAQTTPTPLLRVYIDSSPDGGTTWYPSITFAVVSTSTDIQRWDGRTIGLGPVEVATISRIGTTVVTASAITVNTVLAVDHRVRWEFVASATATTATFAIWALCQPYGSYGA